MLWESKRVKLRNDELCASKVISPRLHENRSESLRCVSERLVGDVRIAGGGLRLRVPQQPDDNLGRCPQRDEIQRSDFCSLLHGTKLDDLRQLICRAAQRIIL